jgi:hypothetical protein
VASDPFYKVQLQAPQTCRVPQSEPCDRVLHSVEPKSKLFDYGTLLQVPQALRIPADWGAQRLVSARALRGPSYPPASVRVISANAVTEK